MKKRGIVGLVVLMLGIVLCTSTQAMTYYVDFENGNDTNPGNCTTSAWKTLPGSVNYSGSGWKQIRDGDSVIVKGGTINPVQVKFGGNYYNGSSHFDSITVISGHLTIPSWGEGRAVFDEEFNRTFGFYIGGNPLPTLGLTVDGFEIRNVKGGGVDSSFDPIRGSAGVDVGGNYPVNYTTIRRMYIHHTNRSIDDTGHGIECGHNSYLIVEYNTIGPAVGTKCIEPYRSDYGVIRNNFIRGCGDHAVALTKANHFDIYNNIIFNNPPQVNEPQYSISISGSSYNDIWNNLIYRSLPNSSNSGEDWSMGIGMYTNDTGIRIVHNTIANFGDYHNAGSSTLIRIGESIAGNVINGTVFANNILYKGFNAAGNIQYAVRLHTVFNEVVEFNDLFYNTSNENVMANYNGLVWNYSSVNNFPNLSGHTYRDNLQMNPLFSLGILPSGMDANWHPNTDYFVLTNKTPLQIRETGNIILGDSLHGYSSDPNKFAKDIVENSRTIWSMGAYEYVNESLIVSVCGDAILERGEQCDDGNLNDTDACFNNCTLNNISLVNSLNISNNTGVDNGNGISSGSGGGGGSGGSGNRGDGQTNVSTNNASNADVNANYSVGPNEEEDLSEEEIEEIVQEENINQAFNTEKESYAEIILYGFLGMVFLAIVVVGFMTTRLIHANS